MWKAIEGTNGMIEVNEHGEVRSLLRGTPRMLKTQTDKKGYQRIRVTICQVKMSFKVHREVAKAFIPNPNNLPQVNHMDGNKSNNCVDNLEWCTNRQNVIHAIEIGAYDPDGIKISKSVEDIDYSIHKKRRQCVEKTERTKKTVAPIKRELVRKEELPKTFKPRKKREDWNNPNPKKAIIGFHDGEVKRFQSVSEAEIFLDSRHISDVLKGKRKHVKGWSFEYAKGGGECDTDVTRT